MIENDISEPVSTVEVLKHHPHDAMRQTVGSSMVAIGLRGISKTLSSTESGVMPSIRIGESNRTPIEFAMISVDFTESRNSLSSHGKWLRSLQRRTAAFCRLNHTASTIPTMKCVGWDGGQRPTPSAQA